MDPTHFSANIICLETQAFYALIEEVVERIREKETGGQELWIGESEAMKLLGIKSKTTLQKYRDEGKIRFSQPSRKVILYDRGSILGFIEQNAKDTF